MVAYAFSKTLLCQEGKDEPCNKCISCRKFDGANHPDFFVIEAEKDVIRKAQIEGLISQMATAPFESKKKIFIIDDSHKMNLESKNSLLKTLEEPAEFAHIILISSASNKLLATILSRLHTIKFFPLNPREIELILEKEYNKSPKEASFIAEFSRGAMGKSIELAKDDDFFQRREEVLNIIDSLIRGDRTRVFSSLSFFNENKEAIADLLDIFIYWFRDILIYKSIGESKIDRKSVV